MSNDSQFEASHNFITITQKLNLKVESSVESGISCRLQHAHLNLLSWRYSIAVWTQSWFCFRGFWSDRKGWSRWSPEFLSSINHSAILCNTQMKVIFYIVKTFNLIPVWKKTLAIVVRHSGHGVLAGLSLASILKHGSQKIWLHG